MNGAIHQTIGDRLEHFETSVSTSNLFALGLLGSIACVAAGALNQSLDIFRSFYFFILGFAAIAIAWSRFFPEARASEIHQEIDLGDAEISDPIPNDKFPFWHRDYFFFAICCASVSALALVFLLALWTTVIDEWLGVIETRLPLVGRCLGVSTWIEKNAENMIWCAITISVLFSIAILFRGHFLYSSEVESAEEPDEISVTSGSYDPSTSLLTCAHLLRVFEGVLEKSILFGVILLAQVSCIAAGALKGASNLHHALVFSAIVFGTVHVARMRAISELGATQLRKATGLDEDKLMEPPREEDVGRLYMLRRDVLPFSFSLWFPPLILLLGNIMTYLGVTGWGAYATSLVLMALLVIRLPVSLLK